jgi:hypothetical protein
MGSTSFRIAKSDPVSGIARKSRIMELAIPKPSQTTVTVAHIIMPLVINHEKDTVKSSIIHPKENISGWVNVNLTASIRE